MAMEVATGAMMSVSKSKELSHLGLVSEMFDELKIAETIDGLIEQDFDQRKVSIGQTVKAMVLNGLGYANQRLYLFPKYFEGKPVEKLIGEGITASDLNEHVCGRALDAIFEADPTNVYSAIAPKALACLNMTAKIGHLDSTSFHTDGDYKFEEEAGVINITKGYSRDHRPELNQFGLELIAESQAGIPILMSAISGNQDDKTHFRSTVQEHISRLKVDVGLEYLIADSAFYTAKTIQAANMIYWISRVPETIAVTRDLIEMLADELVGESDGKKPIYRSTGVSYAGVDQHWLIVYSPQARERASKSVAKLCLKKSSADAKAFDKLCKRSFACEADALEALELCKKELMISMVDDVEIEAKPCFNKPGRPSSDAKPDYFQYRVTAALASDHHQYEQRLRRKSCFILASNQTDTTILPADQLLSNYKKQQNVERGFRFLKDPMFLASSVFLKSPKRIMALTMVMTVCLLVYAALEHRIRKALLKSKQLFPNQKGIMVNRPTVRWIFQCFQNIQVIYFNSAKPMVMNLNSNHATILKLLGKPYEKIYS